MKLENITTPLVIKQVSNEVLQFFNARLEQYECSFNQSPITEDDPTCLITLIKPIVASKTMNIKQAQKLYEHANDCIGIELAFQELASDLLGEVNNSNIEDWTNVRNFIKSKFRV